MPALTAELGVAQRLTQRTDVVGYDVAALLCDDRSAAAALLSQAPTQKAEPGTLVLALVETAHQEEEEDSEPDTSTAGARTPRALRRSTPARSVRRSAPTRTPSPICAASWT